jgi:hypothetical protein
MPRAALRYPYAKQCLTIHRGLHVVAEWRRNSVVEMTRTASVSALASEFDDFLFAAIGEDRNGTLLSVLSMLARLGVDPWDEAAKLALLPEDIASQRLASLIAALPDRPPSHLDPGTLASRLIVLLRRPARCNITSRAALLGVGVVSPSRITKYVISYMIFAAFVLVTQSISASRRPPAQVDNARSPITSTTFSHVPSPSPGQ